MGTAVEMLFVVFAHFGRQAGYVVTPAGKNFSNNRINAIAHKDLLGYGNYSWIAAIGSACRASITRLSNNVWRGPRAFSAVPSASSGWLLSSDRCASTMYDALPSYSVHKNFASLSFERCPVGLPTRCLTDQG